MSKAKSPGDELAAIGKRAVANRCDNPGTKQKTEGLLGNEWMYTRDHWMVKMEISG